MGISNLQKDEVYQLLSIENNMLAKLKYKDLISNFITQKARRIALKLYRAGPDYNVF